MGKNICVFVVGEEPIVNGLNILGAHIDSPRVDIKQNPVYEKNDFVLLDTHYYGGIVKYQWVTTPLAIHGVVVKKDGSIINVVIGEDEKDPVFVISDLLPHLAAEKMQKSGAKVIEGEDLDVTFASIPLDGEEKDAVLRGLHGVVVLIPAREHELLYIVSGGGCIDQPWCIVSSFGCVGFVCLFLMPVYRRGPAGL